MAPGPSPCQLSTSFSRRRGLAGADCEAKPARNENVACQSGARQARHPRGPSRAAPGLPLAVDHLDGLVERLHRQPQRRRAQVQPLPGAARRDRARRGRSGRARRSARRAARSRAEHRASGSSQAWWLVSAETGNRRAYVRRSWTGPPRRASARRDGRRSRRSKLRNQRSLSAIMALSAMIASVASTTAASNSRRFSPSSKRNTRTRRRSRPWAAQIAPVLRRRLAAIVGVPVGVAIGDGGDRARPAPRASRGVRRRLAA